MLLPEAHRKTACGHRDRFCRPEPACPRLFESAAAHTDRSRESVEAGWPLSLAVCVERGAAVVQTAAYAGSQPHLRARRVAREPRPHPIVCGLAHRGISPWLQKPFRITPHFTAHALLLTRFKTVTHPGLRHDIAWGDFIRFKFLAQMSNEHTQILRLLCAIWPPHRCQENMMSDNLSRVSGQVHQEVELLGCQMHLVFLNFDLARWNVDAEISNLDHRSLWLELDGRSP